MRRCIHLFGVLASVATIAASAILGAPAIAAHASAHASSTSNHAVFVQTNDVEGNAIVAFHRQDNGTLSLAAKYPTGGKGGRESGATSDPLASQGSLVFDAADNLLFAVNAGSNTVSVFGVAGDVLHLHQVIASGGSFPVSFARHGNLLYVLNAGLEGKVSGFHIANGQLSPIDGSSRSLDLSNTNPPFFLSSPAQVGFTPAGDHLVVTTKNNSLVDVFGVNADGLLTNHPVKNAVSGVPFAFGFDSAGQLVVANAGSTTNGIPNSDTSTLGTYTIHADGTLSIVSGPVTNKQTAACWVTTASGFDYVANTGSGTLSQYRINSSGTVTLVRAVAASNIAGPTDLASAGGFLDNVSGLSSSVDVFAVSARGALTLIQTRAVPDGESLEGIVAL